MYYRERQKIKNNRPRGIISNKSWKSWVNRLSDTSITEILADAVKITDMFNMTLSLNNNKSAAADAFAVQTVDNYHNQSAGTMTGSLILHHCLLFTDKHVSDVVRPHFNTFSFQKK